jgi:hypothetical protein
LVAQECEQYFRGFVPFHTFFLKSFPQNWHLKISPSRASRCCLDFGNGFDTCLSHNPSELALRDLHCVPRVVMTEQRVGVSCRIGKIGGKTNGETGSGDNTISPTATKWINALAKKTGSNLFSFFILHDVQANTKLSLVDFPHRDTGIT